MENETARGNSRDAPPILQYKNSGCVPGIPADDLQVVIPHKGASLTKAALKYAAGLASDLNVRLRLIDVHVVPYGVPLDEPTVDPKYLTRKLRNLARESTVPISAEIVYARDWEQGLRRSLSPGSLVLMAIKRSWWRSSEKRLAARLRKLGHQVIWVEAA